ncbi:nuclear transport factor 2 family protein [Luminiphilus sp.]|nr:nuclear transport factor 2 family protein [Luminiphilus sp.]
MTATDDRQRIQDLMLAYAAAVDDNDMTAYRDCFDDDVEIVGFGESSVHGADNWVASVSGQLEAFSGTQHLLSPPLATVAGDRASARTDVQALHFLKTPAGGTFTLWATYLTDFIQTQDTWKIARHELVVRGTHQHP